ncbi:hypothetical protein [Paracoccus laeviglucosivorans]|uniref:Uncharacterized protein n=1 Tax=Paracoccus laeviglucosivorans TaxID=1197861 RepID=A0A521CDB3_9RHOB|nr:hypothetical protein [Paracoccus laeviglucosivorans]SMO57403.1 hypothetical protein SAMN06265221_104220 [Paracoccus laeviglucosivorans]
MSHHEDDREQTYPDAPLTDADVTSETRFGPRPVPEGHRRPHEHHDHRRIPPHGDVSPDGSRVWPRPSASARWLVWGGTALAVAGATAGAVIAARHIAQALGDDDKPRRPAQPRGFADTGARMAPPGPPPSSGKPWHDEPHGRRGPRRRPRLMDEVQDNAASLSGSVDGMMRSLTTALSGFRTVAGQAGAIMREFGDAADLVRGVMGHDDGDKPRRHRKAAHRRPSHPAPKDPTAYADRHGTHMPDLHNDPLTDDPTDERDYRRPTDPRMHRL